MNLYVHMHTCQGIPIQWFNFRHTQFQIHQCHCLLYVKVYRLCVGMCVFMQYQIFSIVLTVIQIEFIPLIELWQLINVYVLVFL